MSGNGKHVQQCPPGTTGPTGPPPSQPIPDPRVEERLKEGNKKMNMLSRRALIGAAPLILAACATHPTGGTIASKTRLVADAVEQLAADLALATNLNIPASVMNTVNKLAADVEANADAIAAALDPAPIIQAIYNDVILAGQLVEPFYARSPQIARAVASAIKLITDLMAELGVGPK